MPVPFHPEPFGPAEAPQFMPPIKPERTLQMPGVPQEYCFLSLSALPPPSHSE